MANITNYSTLVSNFEGADGWSQRTDLAALTPVFIQLAEAAMQVRCKLVSFESTATVTITAGVGTLPTDFAGMRSCYWDGDLKRPLKFITPDAFDALRNESATASYYTISGTTIRTTPSGTGSLVMTYNARFLPINGSNATNFIITNYPDAYLYGTLCQLAIWADDDVALQKFAPLFANALERINTDNNDRKYAGPLTVRAR